MGWPPPHPCVNRVLSRFVKGAQCIEVRALCDGGELFDTLVEFDGRLPLRRVLAFFGQLADAVAHCHAHGAVHGSEHRSAQARVLLTRWRAMLVDRRARQRTECRR